MCENYLELFKKSTFTENEVPLLCEAASSLILGRRFDEFETLLFSLETSKVVVLKRNEKFLRALIAFYYERNCYEQVIDLLKSGEFSDYTGLVDIWDDVHYTQKEREIGRPLTPLIRFRTRQKFPPPINISPSGERVTKKLSEEAKSILKNWLSKNSSNPYPSQETREELASKAGLTLYQVKTWFANARRRQKNNEKNSKGRYEIYEKNRKYLLNENRRKSIHCSDIDKDDIELLFRPQSNTPRTVNGSGSKFDSSVIASLLSDQNNNVIYVENNLLKREGCVREGNVRESNVREGGVRKSCVREGNFREGGVREGCVRETSVDEDVECNQNQVTTSCIQHLAQLCRNITYKGVTNHVCNTKEVGGEGQFSVSDVHSNYQQSYGFMNRPLLFQNYQTVGPPENPDSMNNLGFTLAHYPVNMYGGGGQDFNQNLVPQMPNISFAGQTHVQSSSPTGQYSQLSGQIPTQNVDSGMFSTGSIQGTNPLQYNHLPFQSFLQPFQHPRFISCGTQTNYPWIKTEPDTNAFFWSPVQRVRLTRFRKPVVPARPNSCPPVIRDRSNSYQPDTESLLPFLCEEPKGHNFSTTLQQSDNGKWYGEEIQLTPPEYTEEQDVAKVLLDLSSQHSSQESS